MFIYAYMTCRNHLILLRSPFCYTDLCVSAPTTPLPFFCNVVFGKVQSYHPPCYILLVMDPLLRQLQSHSLGISVNNTYAGGFLPADNIRTLANSLSAMEEQIQMVSRFTSENFLKLNEAKCKDIICKKSTLLSLCHSTDGDTRCRFPVRREVKCLGYLWRSNLSSFRMIEERVQRARRAFFQFDSISAFQGDLSPISSVL